MQQQNKQILHKGKSNLANDQDKQQMFALFHQPELEYELKSELLDELENTKTPDSQSLDLKKLFAKLWDKIEIETGKTQSKTRNLNLLLKLAAAVVMGLIIGGLVSSVLNNREPIYYTAHSPKGSISDLLLPDGSVIFLNADSRIRYSVEAKKGIREVFLEGEAWFDVSQNKKKPFIVHTSTYKIYVTGTQFNVKSYASDNYVSTTLEEGEVVISSTEGYRLAEDVVLKPGDQAILNKDSRTLSMRTVEVDRFTAWKEHKLIFVNMNLKELIVLLERKYGVEIKVNNKSILDLHFDGTFKNESIVEILEIIKRTLPVNYVIIDQTVEISAVK